MKRVVVETYIFTFELLVNSRSRQRNNWFRQSVGTEAVPDLFWKEAGDDGREST